MIALAALSPVMGLFGDPRELTRALGYWGALAAAGGTAGVFLGGAITEWPSWRWVFLINVPLGALALAFSPLLPRRGIARRGSVDYAGALAVTGALILAVYAIVTVDEERRSWRAVLSMSRAGSTTLQASCYVLLQHDPQPIVEVNPAVPVRRCLARRGAPRAASDSACTCAQGRRAMLPGRGAGR